MKRFVKGADRRPVTLLPPCHNDCVTENNPVRVVEVFTDELDLGTLASRVWFPRSRVSPPTISRPC